MRYECGEGRVEKMDGGREAGSDNSGEAVSMGAGGVDVSGRIVEAAGIDRMRGSVFVGEGEM